MSDLTETVPSNVDLVFTPAARQAQAARGSDKLYEKRIAKGFPDTITPELAAYVAERDTAFLATVSAAGAPYIQHRGGTKGFIKVVDERTLGFAKASQLAHYLIDVTKAFGSFYRECHVLGQGPAVTGSRLMLVEATRRILAQGLGLLGIPLPERM